MLRQCRAALDPVAAVQVRDAVDLALLGLVDVAADHAVVAAFLRVADKGGLEVRDEVAGALDAELDGLRERVVRKPEEPPPAVVPLVDRKKQLVSHRTRDREEPRVAHHEIELVAMRDEQASAVGRLVHCLHRDLDAAEHKAAELTRRVVVVAGDVDDARPLVRHLEQAPQHGVVRVRPVPALLEAPHVDDVAHEIDLVGLDVLQEPRELLGLRAVRAEVAVADEECPESRLHASNLLCRRSLAVWTLEASAARVQARTNRREGAVRGA